jgi:hypothetical protein
VGSNPGCTIFSHHFSAPQAAMPRIELLLHALHILPLKFLVHWVVDAGNNKMIQRKAG